MKDGDILLGDINLPGIDWIKGTSDYKGGPFFKAVQDNFLTQLVDFPTHKKGNILDLILSKSPEMIKEVKDIGNLGKSDHQIISIEISCDPKNSNTAKATQCWNKADLESIEQELGDIYWEKELKNFNDAENMWLFFKSKILSIQNKYVPTKIKGPSNQPKWMTRELLRLIRKKRRLYKIFKLKRDNNIFERYKKVENEVKKKVKSAKKSFEKKVATSKNDRFFHSYIKSKTVSKSCIGPLKSNGQITANETEIAEILGDFFSSVFTHENNMNIPIPPEEIFEDKLEKIKFEPKDIVKKIKGLKIDSAPGKDEISARLLKCAPHHIAKPLSIIFQKSLETSVPKDWKEANITPIYKKGKKEDPANYRPVSLTSICCKIMESIIKDNITEHLNYNNLIKSSQHGFMNNKSCTTNLLEFLEFVSKAVDEGQPVDIIYLDFAKAFDKVPHRRLILKLKSHGVSGDLLRWIQDWLSDRKQRVVLNGNCSTWKKVVSGVPQGSVLGPLLFIIYINDIDLETAELNVITKFADDTKGAKTVVTDSDRVTLQSVLNKLCEWGNKWGMQFNETKCKVLHCGKNNPKFSYKMNDVLLASVSEEKDLGLIIQENLQTSHQCASSANKANFMLGQISRAFHYRDKNTFLTLYKQRVRPLLEFSTPVWRPWLKSDIDILEQVQKRAIGMISGLKSDTYSGKLRELNLMSLEERRERADMISTFKILNGFDRVNYSTWFTKVSEMSHRLTRQSADCNRLSTPISNLELRKNFFSVRVVSKWNSLPEIIKNSKTVFTFKDSYDRWFYSLTR